MAQWGSIDQSNNSPLWGAALVKLDANTASRDALFGNTTPLAYRPKQTIGVFGAGNTEVGTSNGSLLATTVTYLGSGYTANPTITLSGNGTATAVANSFGKVASITVTAVGNQYATSPVVTFSAPPTLTFAANTTGLQVANSFINIPTNVLQNGDKVTYSVATGNTALANLVSNTKYVVLGANTSGVQLSKTGQTPIVFGIVVTDEAGHLVTGETAQGVITVSGNKGICHTGWVLRREGSGGRAGRVHYENLVAGGIQGDAEEVILKNN